MIDSQRFFPAGILGALVWLWVASGSGASAQDTSPDSLRPSPSPTPSTGSPAKTADERSGGTAHADPGKRVFGVLPNYRTANASDPFAPLSAHRKLEIATKDSFDYPLVFLAGMFAGLGQWTDQNPSFSQGAAGYARRLGTSYGDQAIGNMLTEGIVPSLLKQDPRYFRLGEGTAGGRTFYAVTRIFVTKNDGNGKAFNFSEVLGNAAGVAISNAYYPDGRTASQNATKLIQQLGTDALSQVLKEFWPDIRRKLFSKKSREIQ